MTAEDNVDIFMPLYVADYLSATTDLSTEEHGAYLLLLLNLWKRGGSLPLDHHRLARMVGLRLEAWEPVWFVIERFFNVSDGTISQGRLVREMEAARGRKRRATDNGKAGGAAKAKNAKSKANASNSLANVYPEASQTSSNSSSKTPSNSLANVYPEASSSPSPSPSPSTPTSASPDPEGPRARVRAPARPRARMMGAAGASVFDSVIESFRLVWASSYGAEYHPTPADRSQLGRMLSGLPPGLLPSLPDLFANYLRDREPFVAQKMRHSLTYFCTQGGVNKYAVETPILSEKEARGVAAGEQWLAMHEAKNGGG